MDKDNFEMVVQDPRNPTLDFTVKMVRGELTIDGCDYENNPEDPTYALCIMLAKYRGII